MMDSRFGQAALTMIPVPPVLPTRKDSTLGTAGDCCAAGFRLG
jgi:hypothetical protein